MTTTDARMLEALKRALDFEDDGVAYYEKAMGECSDEVAVGVLQTLRDEEVEHKARILEIYQKVSGGGSFRGEDPTGAPMPDFVSVFEQLGRPPKAVSGSEIDALRHALEIESRGRDMYAELSAGAPTDVEKRFYTRLGDEEKTHLALIEDSLEYFEDPEGWFQKHERSGLDGA